MPELRDQIRGIEQADSWATDAHKWLNVPYDSGLAMVRHTAAHRAAMSFKASYCREDRTKSASAWIGFLSRRAARAWCRSTR